MVQTFRSLVNEGNIFREFSFSRLRFSSRNSQKLKPRENFYLYSIQWFPEASEGALILYYSKFDFFFFLSSFTSILSVLSLISRILEFETNGGQNGNRTQSAEVELWDCSGNSKWVIRGLNMVILVQPWKSLFFLEVTLWSAVLKAILKCFHFTLAYCHVISQKRIHTYICTGWPDKPTE